MNHAGSGITMFSCLEFGRTICVGNITYFMGHKREFLLYETVPYVEIMPTSRHDVLKPAFH